MAKVVSEHVAPQLSFRLPLESARLLRARQRMRDYLREQRVLPKHINEIVLALQEAMTNAVRHSDASDELEVGLRFEGKNLVAEVCDKGCGFDVEGFDPQRLPDLGGAGGRGLYLIAHLMDDLKLQSNGGLKVRMVKRDVLAKAAEAAHGTLESKAPGAEIHRDRRQKSLLDEIPEAYAALDWEFRYVYVNEAACRMSRRSRQELLGDCLWDVFPEVVGTEVEPRLRETMELGVASSHEFYFPPLEGWFEQRLYPTLSGLSQFTTEITQRKQRDLERLRLADELQSIIAASRDIVYRLDLRTGRYDYISPEAERVTGFSIDELTAMDAETVLALVHRDDLPLLREAIRVSEEQGQAEAEYRQRTKEGAYRWLSNRIVLTRDADGAPAYRTGNIRDVTEAREAEDRLRMSERRLRLAKEATGLGVHDFDVTSGSIQWDERARELWGVELEEPITYETFMCGLHPDDREATQAAVDRSMDPMGDGVYEAVYRVLSRRDGQERWVRDTGQVYFADRRPVRLIGTVEDVTERKRADEQRLELLAAVQRERDSLSALIARVPDEVWFADSEGTVSLVNPAVWKEFGALSAAQIETIAARFEVYRSDGTPRPPSEAPPLRALHGEIVTNEEEIVRTPAGDDLRHRLISAAPVRDSDGVIIGSVCVVRDVTECKRVDEALRESEKKYRELLVHAPAGIYEIDFRQRRFTSVNDVMCVMTGYSREELLSMDPLDLLVGDGRERFQTRVTRWIRGEAPESDVEYRVRMKDGREVDALLDVTFTSGQDGAPLGATVVARDITERKRAEKALNESEKRLRALVNAMSDAVYRMSPDWTEMRLLRGRRFIDDTDGPDDTWLDRYIHPDDQLSVKAAIEEAIARKSLVALEHRVRRVDGTLGWVSSRAVPQLGDEDEIVEWVGIATDVTERKRNEQALRRQADLLDRVSDAVVATDSVSRVVTWNRAAEDSYGWTSQEACGRNVDELLHARFVSMTREEAMARLEADGHVAVTVIHHDRSGGEHFVESSVTLLKGEQGSDSGSLAVLRDITTRRRDQETVEIGRRRLAIATEAAELGVYDWDVRSGTIEWDERGYDLWGVDPGEPATYDTFMASLHPDDRGPTQALIDAALDPEGDGRYEATYRIHRRSDLKQTWIRATGHVFFECDEPVRLVGTVEDVSQRREEEAERVSLLAIAERELSATHLLVDAAEAASSSLTPREVCERIIASLRRESEDLHAVSVHELAGNGRLRLIASYGYPEEGFAELEEFEVATTSNLGRLVLEGADVLTHECGGEAPESVERRRRLGLEGNRWIDLPVRRGGELRAVMALYFEGLRSFQDDETRLYQGVADILGNALANARLYEAQSGIAQTLQEALLGQKPEIESFELGLIAIPAWQPALVGGDFWDIFELPDRKLLVCMGDVAGKGLQAAALTEKIRSTMRAFALVDSSPAFVLRKSNELLSMSQADTPFVTALVLIIDVETGEARLASAGHPGPILIHGRDIDVFDPPHGLPLGTFRTEYTSTKLQLMRGDALVLYTDGLTDARRPGELFGEHGVMRTLRAVDLGQPQDTAELLASAAASFAGRLSDDLQVLVMKRR